MSASSKYPFKAGVWEQYAEERGTGFVGWSRHRTETAARRAAIKYAKSIQQSAGGSLSWAGGVETQEGSVTWYDRTGDVVQRSHA